MLSPQSFENLQRRSSCFELDKCTRQPKMYPQLLPYLCLIFHAAQPKHLWYPTMLRRNQPCSSLEIGTHLSCWEEWRYLPQRDNLHRGLVSAYFLLSARSHWLSAKWFSCSASINLEGLGLTSPAHRDGRDQSEYPLFLSTTQSEQSLSHFWSQQLYTSYSYWGCSARKASKLQLVFF